MIILKSLAFGLAAGAALIFSGNTSQAMGNCGPIAANPGGVYDTETLPPDFEKRIVEALNDINVTADFAVGIVKGDKVIFAKGFGFSDLETCEPVTTETGFYLLSTTKSFTGMAAGLLHEEGILDLDLSLAHYFSGLEMPEGINPGQISVRSLLTHGKTFGNATINFRTFAPGNLPDEQLLDVLSTYSEPKEPDFRYSNTGYVMAGYVMQTVTDQSWRDILEKRIFAPLGMKNSFAYIEKALQHPYGRPYYRDPTGGMVEGFLKTENQMHAAGGMVSTVDDMNRWLTVNLNEGRIEGEQVLPERLIRQAHAPQIQLSAEYYLFQRFAYGYGVYNADYEGDLLIHHFGGGIHYSIMPEHDLGVVILTGNPGQGAAFAHAIAALAYDTLLGKENLDKRWKEAMAQVSESVESRLQRYRDYETQLEGQANPEDPIFDNAAIVGRYINDRLGEFVVTQTGDNLEITYGDIKDTFLRLDGNTFTAFLIPLDMTPTQVVDAREDEDLGLVLDWGGRIFVRQ